VARNRKAAGKTPAAFRIVSILTDV
jgi:hypothetical protein